MACCLEMAACQQKYHMNILSIMSDEVHLSSANQLKKPMNKHNLKHE